jgi:hypothetical protein
MPTYSAFKNRGMALYIDQQRFAFANVPDSPNLYVKQPLVFFPVPWKQIKIFFGGSKCLDTCIYFFETHKVVPTEFGPLEIRLLLEPRYPYYYYHFILKASVL